MSEIVSKVQLRLEELGLYNGGIDGICGDKTAAAVRQFQSTIRGLVVDGIPGPATQAALLRWDPIPERDIDPPRAEPVSAKPIWPRQPDVERFYGAPGEHQAMLEIPYPMILDWEVETPVRRFSIHEKGPRQRSQVSAAGRRRIRRRRQEGTRHRSIWRLRERQGDARRNAAEHARLGDCYRLRSGAQRANLGSRQGKARKA